MLADRCQSFHWMILLQKNVLILYLIFLIILIALLQENSESESQWEDISSEDDVDNQVSVEIDIPSMGNNVWVIEIWLFCVCVLFNRVMV